MSEQTESYPGSDNAVFGDELEKLFVFQDKHLSREKKAILVDEIEKSSFPKGAVISGLRALHNEDLTSIKLGRILAAIRVFVAPSETARNCERCMDGLIVMRDSNGYRYSLGCVCQRGNQRSTAMGVVQWDGEATMQSNGRILSTVYGE